MDTVPSSYRSTTPTPRSWAWPPCTPAAPVDAVVAVDDRGVLAAAPIARRLGLAQHHNPLDVVAATRDKPGTRAGCRRRRAAHPYFAVAVDAATRRRRPTTSASPASSSPSAWPPSACDPRRRRPTWSPPPTRRGDRRRPLLVEEYVPGHRDRRRRAARASGVLEVLARVRQARPARRSVLRGDDLRHAVAPPRRRSRPRSAPHRRRARAIGLTEGPCTRSCASTGDRVAVIEVAARSIGGLCASHAALRRGHRARGADPAPRVRGSRSTTSNAKPIRVPA